MIFMMIADGWYFNESLADNLFLNLLFSFLGGSN